MLFRSHRRIASTPALAPETRPVVEGNLEDDELYRNVAKGLDEEGVVEARAGPVEDSIEHFGQPWQRKDKFATGFLTLTMTLPA